MPWYNLVPNDPMVSIYFGIWWGADPRLEYVNSILLWVVIACLGWATFGPMVR
jgi:hypothetical protein